MITHSTKPGTNSCSYFCDENVREKEAYVNRNETFNFFLRIALVFREEVAALGVDSTGRPEIASSWLTT
jgi:hypothetical protein